MDGVLSNACRLRARSNTRTHVGRATLTACRRMGRSNAGLLSVSRRRRMLTVVDAQHQWDGFGRPTFGGAAPQFGRLLPSFDVALTRGEVGFAGHRGQARGAGARTEQSRRNVTMPDRTAGRVPFHCARGDRCAERSTASKSRWRCADSRPIRRGRDARRDRVRFDRGEVGDRLKPTAPRSRRRSPTSGRWRRGNSILG